MTILIGGFRRTIIDSNTGDLVQAETVCDAVNYYISKGYTQIIPSKNKQVNYLKSITEDIFVRIEEVEGEIVITNIRRDTFLKEFNSL